MSERECLIPELCEGCERQAANLWRAENPDKSVFACDAAEQSKYRARILVEGCVRQQQPVTQDEIDAANALAETFEEPGNGEPARGAA